LKVKFSGLVSSRQSVPEGSQPSFWGEVVDATRAQAPEETTIGYLQVQSPYMHRAALYALLCLEAALDRDCNPELYAFLDGIHIGHANQHPTAFRNLGEGFSDLTSHASQHQRHYLLLGSAPCATERGYGMWDDGKGLVISSCTIKPLKLRSLTGMVERFTKDHSILGTNSGSIQLRLDHPGIVDGLPVKDHAPPSLVILITGSPYTTEMTMGALSFAIASAHQGIGTRVVFIEDGVYALSGEQKIDAAEQFFSLQDMINSASRNDRLEFFAHQPSLHQRGLVKNKKFNAVLDINNHDLGKLLFESPQGVRCRYQRLLFF
jgi:tRNA 2-thiouridine synthesizing protein C